MKKAVLFFVLVLVLITIPLLYSPTSADSSVSVEWGSNSEFNDYDK